LRRKKAARQPRARQQSIGCKLDLGENQRDYQPSIKAKQQPTRVDNRIRRRSERKADLRTACSSLTRARQDFLARSAVAVDRFSRAISAN